MRKRARASFGFGERQKFLWSFGLKASKTPRRRGFLKLEAYEAKQSQIPTAYFAHLLLLCMRSGGCCGLKKLSIAPTAKVQHESPVGKMKAKLF
jgi:hypothetical protein